jgi:uncharacterized MAPEG superfamily protein
VPTLSDNPAFLPYALASSILSLQILVLALLTGLARLRGGIWVNPEDAEAFKGEKVAADHPDVVRANRSHMNTLENAVPFFVVGWLYVLTGATRTGATTYFATFVAARILHSIAYALGIQPWRSIAFFIGVFAIVGMAVHVIRAAI